MEFPIYIKRSRKYRYNVNIKKGRNTEQKWTYDLINNILREREKI